MRLIAIWLMAAGWTIAIPSTGDGVRGGLPLAAATNPDSLSVRTDAEAAVRRYFRSVGDAYMRELPEDRTAPYVPYLPLVLASDYRPSVIAALDGFALEISGDDWIAGQRVGLRIKQGWTSEAIEVARECQGSPWWCKALLGWTLHEEGRITEAEAVFDASLEAMPPEVRCAWSDDLAVILQGGLRSQFRATPCEEREGLERRIWWLADQLHIVPGNDRRTDQFSRMVAMKLHHEALDLIGGQCSVWHHARALSGGWHSWWWVVVNPNVPELEGFPTIPTGSTWMEPLSTGPDDWYAPLRRSGERYLPPYGPLAPLDQQTAFFARGDALLAISAVGTTERMRLAGVAFSRNEDEPRFVVTDSLAPGPFRFEVRVPREAYLVSVEAMAMNGEAHRTRFGHRLPEPNARGLGLSDPLLLEWDGRSAENLDEALPRMLGSERIEPDRELGLFWEMYGAPESATVDYHLAVRPEDRGLFRRIGEALRILGRRSSVSLRWQERVAGGDVAGRELRLDLSALTPGFYALVLEVDDGSGETVAALRRIEVVGG